MINKKTNEPPAKKSKLLLVLPLVAFPFLALAFWALGGGHAKDPAKDSPAGLNASLPDANLPDDSAMNKMSFYEQEEKAGGKSTDPSIAPDSFGLAALSDMGFQTDESQTSPYDYGQYTNSGANKGYSGNSASASEKEIRSKLQQLQDNLERSEKENEYTNTGNNPATANAGQLTNLMANNEGEDTPDPEMDKLQAMMNRIYDIQHPDEVNSRLQKESEANRGMVFPVGITTQPSVVHLLSANSMLSDSSQGKILNKTNGFYGLATTTSSFQSIDKGLAVVVQENTTIVNGASVKLRLLQDVFINGIAIPAGNFLSGQAQLSNDRVMIDITSILYNQYVFQVKLSAFDTDGMQGLYVPNSINRDVLKQSGDNALQGLGIASVDPSIGAQAAAAGIETAKTLFSRKLKLTKVFLKAGHRVILKGKQQ